MQVLKIGYEIDESTFHRDLVADVRVKLSIEVLQDLAAARGLNVENEIEHAIGAEVLAAIMAARRQMV